MTRAKNLEAESDDLNSKVDSLIDWRKEKVWELKSCGLTIDEIVVTLKPKPGIKISHGTVHRILRAKQKEIEENFKNYIEKELPMQHSLAVTGLDLVVKEAWRIYARAADDRIKLGALQTISTATMQKQAVLGDPTQIEKAIKLVGRLRSQMIDQGHADQDEPGKHREGDHQG